ncbi:hypothetical protein [Aliikangiella sp. G2MR2-5]|uniref:hypothetical protein n=1 Tax=Aliikangiella sp. G2MR2-5 TaxID=2788943 RepID=UPI0018ABDBB4|nr:hypothetical protein [Aliikangiella sp. G2MR2-5]
MMKVFWVESIDHSEDWFVVAPDVEIAVSLFASEMGYDIFSDEVIAEEVCLLPENLHVNFPSPDFLDNDSVLACGGEFIDFHDQDLLEHVSEDFLRTVAGETRIVRFGKKVYMEGNVMRVALQMEGKLKKC